jgi:hypothetical protein
MGNTSDNESDTTSNEISPIDIVPKDLSKDSFNNVLENLEHEMTILDDTIKIFHGELSDECKNIMYNRTVEKINSIIDCVHTNHVKFVTMDDEKSSIDKDKNKEYYKEELMKIMLKLNQTVDAFDTYVESYKFNRLKSYLPTITKERCKQITIDGIKNIVMIKEFCKIKNVESDTNVIIERIKEEHKDVSSLDKSINSLHQVLKDLS